MLFCWYPHHGKYSTINWDICISRSRIVIATMWNIRDLICFGLSPRKSIYEEILGSYGGIAIIKLCGITIIKKQAMELLPMHFGGGAIHVWLKPHILMTWPTSLYPWSHPKSTAKFWRYIPLYGSGLENTILPLSIVIFLQGAVRNIISNLKKDMNSLLIFTGWHCKSHAFSMPLINKFNYSFPNRHGSSYS